MNPGQQNQQSNQGANKQGGLSWSTPPSAQGGHAISGSANQSPLLGGAAKPVPAATPKPATASLSSTAVARSRPADTNNMRSIWIFITGVLVGMLVMWSWGAIMTTTPAETTNTQNGGNTIPSTGGNNATIGANGANTAATAPGIAATDDVIVLSQDAGNAVVVKDASVSGPTWLAVYELYEGKPIRALGATMFFPEHNGRGGVITLLRSTEPNTTYFVGQSLDTGDHTFTPHVNKEVLDSSGKMIGTTFKTN